MNYRDAAAYMAALSMLLGANQQFINQGKRVHDAKMKLGRGPLVTQAEYDTVLTVRDKIVAELRAMIQEGGKGTLTSGDLQLPYTELVPSPEEPSE